MLLGWGLLKARFVKGWPAALGAAGLWAAFPPLNLSLLVFAAIAPWLLSLRTASGWGAVRSGYLFGFLFFLGQFLWMQTFISAWTSSFWLGVIPWVLGASITAWYGALFAWLARLCWKLDWPWAIPLVWAGVEVVRSYVPLLAFPYGLIPMPLWRLPQIIQGAHYGTIYLVSAWVLLMNVVLAQMLAGDSFARMRVHLAVFAGILGLSLARYSEPVAGTRKVVTVGQLGVNLAFVSPGYEGLVKDAVESLFDSALLQGSSLLVLPEGVARSYGEIPPTLFFRYPPGLPFLFGSQRGRAPRYQSAFAYDGQWKYTDKNRLVIFGEYVPFRDYLPFLKSFNIPGGDLTPGTEVKALQAGSIKVGPILCFEGLFHDVALRQAINGAQLLAVMSIDDWYMGSAAPEQLRMAAVWRAVETGLPLVRSASLGYSLAVDARGNVLAEAPLGKRFPLRVELDIPQKADLFPPVNVFPWLAAASCVAAPLAAAFRLRRPKT